MIRLPFAVFLAVFAASALFTVTRPKIYEATATLQLPARVHHSEPVVHSVTIQSSEESSATYIKIAESNVMLQRVSARLTATDLENLRAHRHASFDLATRSLTISYRDRDPTHAAQVANLFADEVNAFCIRTREDETRYAIAQIQERTDAQARQVEVLSAALANHPASATPDPEYQKLERDLAIHRDILTQLQARLAEARSVKSPPPFTITLATPPATDDYVSPPVLLHLALGTLGGTLAGLLAARHTSKKSVLTKSRGGAEK